MPSAQSLVVIFAYHFPPDPAIGSARPFRFYKYLSRLGYSCHVVTAAEQRGDTAGISYVPDLFEEAVQRGWEWQAERALRWRFLPGAVGSGWSRRACAAAREIVERHGAGRVTVISSFPPVGAHLAGWQLARRRDTAWIADFRDPLGGVHANELTAYQRALYRWLERRVIRAADGVIANTDAVQKKWQQQFPERATAIHLVWNGFDPEARITAKPLPCRGYKVLAHTGELYAGRTVVPLLESIARLMAQGGVSGVRVRLVGQAEPAALGSAELLARAEADGWLEITAHSIPQGEAREIMQTSDYLLLVQPQSTVQVPGKLFEYLQIGRPILAFIPPGSPIERILGESGVPFRCIYPNDASGRIDEKMAEFLQMSTETTALNPNFEENFSAEAQARSLARIIETTTRRSGS